MFDTIRLNVLEQAVQETNFAERVRALRSEAAKAGDLAQVRLCGQALEDVSPDNPACLDCANVLRGAES